MFSDEKVKFNFKLWFQMFSWPPLIQKTLYHIFSHISWIFFKIFFLYSWLSPCICMRERERASERDVAWSHSGPFLQSSSELDLGYVHTWLMSGGQSWEVKLWPPRGIQLLLGRVLKALCHGAGFRSWIFSQHFTKDQSTLSHWLISGTQHPLLPTASVPWSFPALLEQNYWPVIC